MKTYILGVDPGTTTGLSLVSCESDALWIASHSELSWHEATDELSRLLRDMRSLKTHENTKVIAVGEQFTINANTHKRGQQTAEDAMFMLGVLKRECRLNDVPLAPLQQTSRKNQAPDPVLKALGLYTPGMKHANDACRHIVALALTKRLFPAKLILELLK